MRGWSGQTPPSPDKPTYESDNERKFPSVGIDVELVVNYLRAINIHPMEKRVRFKDEEDGLDEGLLEIAKHLDDVEEVRFVKGALEARDPDDSPQVQALREKLLKEFAETVFCGKITGDPLFEGPLGKRKLSLIRLLYL